MTSSLLLATTNRGKLREILSLLDGLSLDFTTLDAFPDVEPPEEIGATFAENARQKAVYYASRTGLATVAEDSGLEIDALGGAPGIHSARYCGPDSTYLEKYARIYAEGGSGSPARFVCAVALVAGGRVLFEDRGTVEGLIAPEPRGEGGFGYDPIFYYPPFGKTLAEATAAEKSSVSHRGEAFRKLRRFLEAADLPGQF